MVILDCSMFEPLETEMKLDFCEIWRTLFSFESFHFWFLHLLMKTRFKSEACQINQIQMFCNTLYPCNVWSCTNLDSVAGLGWAGLHLHWIFPPSTLPPRSVWTVHYSLSGHFGNIIHTFILTKSFRKDSLNIASHYFRRIVSSFGFYGHKS